MPMRTAGPGFQVILLAVLLSGGCGNLKTTTRHGWLPRTYSIPRDIAVEAGLATLEERGYTARQTDNGATTVILTEWQKGGIVSQRLPGLIPFFGGFPVRTAGRTERLFGWLWPGEDRSSCEMHITEQGEEEVKIWVSLILQTKNMWGREWKDLRLDSSTIMWEIYPLFQADLERNLAKACNKRGLQRSFGPEHSLSAVPTRPSGRDAR